MFLRLSILTAALVLCAPAFAVTGGSLDGGAHPAVGMLLADFGTGVQPDCSGSLVSPTVFLTAGHCTAGLPSSRVWVTFDPQWTPASRLLPGTAYTDPQFGIDRTDSHDLAVVVLDAPVTGVTPLELPQANALAADPDTVVVVGYGADQPAAKKKNPTFTFDFTRRFGTATAKRVSKVELKIDQRDGAGTCRGDSGGPNLLGSTIVAVTSHGDPACTRVGFGYRVDTPSARAFLGQFVPLP